MNTTRKRFGFPDAMSIGELAPRTGTTVETIHYHEKIGFMPPPRRTAGNQRAYDQGLVDRLG